MAAVNMTEGKYNRSFAEIFNPPCSGEFVPAYL